MGEMDYECLDPHFSTTRCVTRVKPLIAQAPNAKYTRDLSLPAADGRVAEGGLRTKGFYKAMQPPYRARRPLITVVLAVLNGAKYIEDAILSVIGQTYDQVEYIVIDGVSTDGSVDIIRRFEYAIDYWVSEPDLGIYDALNKGVSLALGEWICVVGADDYFLSNEVIEKMAARLVDCDPSVKLAYGNVAMVGGNGILCLVGEEWPKAKAKMKQGMSVPYPGLMHRRTWFERYGLYDSAYRIAGDYEMLLRGWPHEEAEYLQGLQTVAMRTGGISNSSRSAMLSERETREAQQRHGIRMPYLMKVSSFCRSSLRFMMQRLLGDNIIWRLHSVLSKFRP